MRRRQQAAVSPRLESQIEDVMAEVDAARAALDEVVAQRAPLPLRRAAHARLTAAFSAADKLLRVAVTAARTQSSTTKPGSFLAWSQWRGRLSRLDAERQAHLFAQTDELGALPPCSVLVVDTGMLGPDIGELQYGRSKPPGTPARIGVDLAAVLGAEGAAPPAAHSEVLDLPPDVSPGGEPDQAHRGQHQSAA